MDTNIKLVKANALLRATLEGVLGMAKIEARHGSTTWAGSVKIIESVLRDTEQTAEKAIPGE